MKKIISICAILLALILTLASCDKEKVCKAHTDENADGKCDVCTEEIEKVCKAHTDENSDGKCDICDEETAVMVNYVLTVKDQDGNAVQGAELTVYAGYDKAASGTTDASGNIVGNLAQGEYTVIFDYLPDGYASYAPSSAMVITADAPAVMILVENITPNGSAERPFPISITDPSITLPASTEYYYSISGGTRLLKIETSDIEVIYGEETYTPDENGKIEITLIPESHFFPIIIKFINKASSEKTFALTFESLPGSPERPFEAKLDTTHTASVRKESTVYYQWIADKTGFITVTSYAPQNTIMLYNKTTMAVSPYTNGKVCEYIWVNEGDELSIAVASTSKEDVATLEFLLNYAKGDTELPLTLLDNSATFTVPAGKEYSFVSRLLGADTVTIKNKNIKVEINGVESAPDENGKVEYVFAPGDIITLINNTDEKCDVTINLSSSAEK